MPLGAGARVGGERLSWWPCPSHVTQQWHFTSMVVWASSRSIPRCGVPHSHPLRLSPHSPQQSSPQVCSPNPTFQHPAPVHTSRHTTQAGACRVVSWTTSVGLTLYCLPQTGCCALLQAPDTPLLSQLISPLAMGVPWVQEPLLSFRSSRSPHRAQLPSCFLSSFFPFLFFILPG